jgi:hypothetical protein
VNFLKYLVPHSLVAEKPAVVDGQINAPADICPFGAGFFAPMLAIFILVGCESNDPAASQPQVDYIVDEAPSERELVARASVTIIERPRSQTIVSPIKLIQVSPSPIVLDQGDSVRLTAEALDADGRSVPDVEIRWAISDGGAGRINKNGRFTAAVEPGFFAQAINVVALQNTPSGVVPLTDSFPVTVLGDQRVPTLTEVVIANPNATVLKGQLFQMRATAFDEEGFPIPDVQIRWTTEKKELGVINVIGQLRVDGDEGLYEEGIRVRATWQGVTKRAYANIRVIDSEEPEGVLNLGIVGRQVRVPVGGTYKFEAVATNGAGDIASNAQVRWYLADPAAGLIDNEGNFVAGDVPGVYSEAIVVEAVIPSGNGFTVATDFASVIVQGGATVGRLKAISVKPGQVKVGTGGRTTFTVQAVDNKGKRVGNVTWWWSILDENVGTVTPLGAFTAGDRPRVYPDALRVTVEQRFEDEIVVLTKPVDVIITGKLDYLVIEPSEATVTTGRTVEFSVTAFDENGVTLQGLIVLWSVDDQMVGEIEPTGTFTAGFRVGKFNNVVKATVIQAIPESP